MTLKRRHALFYSPDRRLVRGGRVTLTLTKEPTIRGIELPLIISRWRKNNPVGRGIQCPGEELSGILQFEMHTLPSLSPSVLFLRLYS